MKVLVVGSGGREHALVWALSRSQSVTSIDCAPGNAGIAQQADCVDIDAADVEALVARATAKRYDLVVVGPEAPLVAGLADRLTGAGIAVFGCSARAAVVEGSKVFAKRFMRRHDIPTAAFEVFEDHDAAVRHLEDPATRYPLVVKADGLAAGKGVILADDAAAARAAATAMLCEGRFGDAGGRIIVEEMLTGREVSFFALADGERFVELETCQDYKRALDGDAGSNTGGMGTYSPSVYLDAGTRKSIVERVVRPTIAGLAAEERPYRGVLYVGVMLTDDGPKVLEYNARFGDPETQALMPRLDGDWFDVLHACATGRLDDRPLRWRNEATVCVVMAAGGYPGSYAKGRVIRGLDAVDASHGESARDPVVVFHAGTGRDADGNVVTTGGRVLGVTASGADLAAARQRAYDAVGAIGWDDEQHRSDIAADAVRRLESERS